MNNTIFRTYDIRGRIPTDFTITDGYRIAIAVLTYYQEQDPTLTDIVVGYDARTTSPALAEQVLAAAHDLGITAHIIGMVSSPEFYHTLHTSKVTSGIMITASHNPAEYNGFKLRLHQRPVWGEEIVKLQQSIDTTCPTALVKSARHPGASPRTTREAMSGAYSTCSAVPSFPARNVHKTLLTTYATDVIHRFKHISGNHIHALIDCGNGATGPAVEKIIAGLKLTNVTLLHTTPDGTFPNHAPDSSNTKNLTELITRVTTADEPMIGLALDGDGDRLGLVLEDGTHLSGDDLLALLAQPVLAQNPGTHVVYDIKSSSRLTRVIPSLDGTGHFTPCGHTYIQNAMRQYNALIGGEVSGHLFFRDRYFGFDDGIYALLRVLELRVESEQALVECFAQLPTAYAAPEQRIACDRKNEVVAQAIERAQHITGAQLITTDGVRVELPEGWILIRAAQTEPALSVRWEGRCATSMNSLQQILGTLLGDEAYQLL